jgi:phage replication-related protein YjqB (UPF0714/DUF867 family)
MSLFTDLLATPGVVEDCELRGSFGFMAFHGGNLEVATDVIARGAAHRCGASYYGVIQPPGLRWHIPSIAVGPSESPKLAQFLGHVTAVVAVHGYGRHGFWTSLLLGGRNRSLANDLAIELRRKLPDYTIIDDIDSIPEELRGQHSLNPVNLPIEHGVQLELPPRVRGTTPHWESWKGPGHVPPVEALIEALAATAITRMRPESPPADPTERTAG